MHGADQDHNALNGLHWPLLVGVLLLIAASRLTRLDELVMNPDEIWSVWQTLGTPAQILQWTPYDWPPLYYLTLAAWREWTGLFPETLRVFSILWFLIGVCCIFRVMHRLRGEAAGILAALTYSALGYGVLLSIEVRGYALLMGLMPLALWLTIRYFDLPRWRRAIPLALALAAMFYTSATSAGAVTILLLYTFVVYGWRVWRWWLPTLVAGAIALPEILAKARVGVTRLQATGTLELSPVPQALFDLFWRYTGQVWLSWALLFVLATFLIAYHKRIPRSHLLALGVWSLAVPVGLYFINPLTGFFSARYAWWMMVGLGLWVAWGLSYLPRAAMLAASLLLVAMTFVRLPTTGEYNIWEVRSSLGNNFDWLRGRLRPGDGILVDAQQRCGLPEEWDYYLRLYFPSGLNFIDSPDAARRIWFIVHDSKQDRALQQTLNENFVPGEFVGPPECLFRLYEAPPEKPIIRFENGMRFHGADIMVNGAPWSGPLTLHEGETIRLRLWWSALQPIERDFSVGVYVFRGDRLITQSDFAPQIVFPVDTPRETSRWQTGINYVEERTLSLPFPTSPGDYHIFLAVYYWEDNVRLRGNGVNQDGLLPLRHFTVKAY